MSNWNLQTLLNMSRINNRLHGAPGNFEAASCYCQWTVWMCSEVKWATGISSFDIRFDSWSLLALLAVFLISPEWWFKLFLKREYLAKLAELYWASNEHTRVRFYQSLRTSFLWSNRCSQNGAKSRSLNFQHVQLIHCTQTRTTQAPIAAQSCMSWSPNSVWCSPRQSNCNCKCILLASTPLGHKYFQISSTLNCQCSMLNFLTLVNLRSSQVF